MMDECPLSTKHLSLFIEESAGLVFHHHTKELHYLNAAAVWVLLSLDEQVPFDLIVAHLVEQNAFTPVQAKDVVDEVARLFISNTNKGEYAKGRYPELAFAPEKDDGSLPSFSICVAKTGFSIRCANRDLYNEISTLLAPVTMEAPSIDVSIVIVQDKSGFRLVVNGEQVQQIDDYQQVMPELIDRIQVLAYQCREYLLCFHGAGVKTQHGIVLIPGQSGAGKSTMCATLCANGGILFSDEMLVFDKHLNLVPIQLPMAIKSGSWPVLDAAYPQLASQTTWQRLDGRYLKYVWPLQCVQQPEFDASVLVVCPQYQDRGHIPADGLESFVKQHPLTIIATMQTMSESGYQVGVEITSQQLKSWLVYLQGAQRFSLSYDKTQSLSDLVNNLWQQKSL